MRSTIIEMKNPLQEFSSRFELVEEGIEKQKDRSIEILQCEEQKEKCRNKNEQRHVEQHQINKVSQETRERKKCKGIMAKNPPNLMKNNLHIQKYQQTLRIDSEIHLDTS